MSDMPPTRDLLEPQIQDEDRRIMSMHLRQLRPFFVEGAPGTGKSLSARYLGAQIYAEFCPARQQHGCQACPYADEDRFCNPVKIDITEDTEAFNLLGDIDYVSFYEKLEHFRVGIHQRARTGSGADPADRSGLDIEENFEPGVLIKAMEQGRLLLVEELDRAGRDTLFSLFFDPIEYKKVYLPALHREITAAPTFNIVFTVNRGTDTGTVPLPGALLRRLSRTALFDPARQNNDSSIAFEQELILRNIEYAAGRSNGYAPAPCFQALLSRPENLHSFLRFYLRDIVWNLRDRAEIFGRISPAETALWIIATLESAPPLELSPDAAPELVERLRLFRGAVCKHAEAEQELLHWWSQNRDLLVDAAALSLDPDGQQRQERERRLQSLEDELASNARRALREDMEKGVPAVEKAIDNFVDRWNHYAQVHAQSIGSRARESMLQAAEAMETAMNNLTDQFDATIARLLTKQLEVAGIRRTVSPGKVGLTWPALKAREPDQNRSQEIGELCQNCLNRVEKFNDDGEIRRLWRGFLEG